MLLGILLIANILKKPETAPVSGELSVHYIDVGQGDCIYIETGGNNMLIDCGEAYKTDEAIAYLSELEVTELDYVVGTHPHSDHMGGMSEIVKNFDIGEFIMPHLDESDIPTTKYFMNFLDEAEKCSLNVREAEPGRKFSLGEAECEIIAPISDNYGNTNDYSVGIIIRYGKNSFIFTGDAEESAEMEMIGSGRLGHIDVYKAGHHGSDTSSSEEFLKVISPDYAVISCGEGNSYGHPADITLEKLGKYTDNIYRTDLCGDIVITSDGKEIEVRTERSGR